MVEVDDVVLDELHAVHEARIVLAFAGTRMSERVLDGATARDGVHDGAHAADPLRERPRVARVTALHDDLDPAELRR